MRFFQIIIAFIVGSVFVYIVLQIYRSQLFGAILKVLTADVRFLMILLVNVFVICGVSITLLFQWIDRENIRFKTRRNRYRSLLASPDYYQRAKRINLDHFVTGTLTVGPQGKLDVDHDLKKSSLVALDETFIHKDARQTYLHYHDGKLDGVFKTYFTNGNLLAEISYKNGLLEGKSVVYYPNGSLHSEKEFKKGKLNGVFRAWDEEGALFFEIEYKDDTQHGFDKIYRKNGVIEYEDTYSNGVLMKRKTFDDFGQFKYIQKYHKDSESHV